MNGGEVPHLCIQKITYASGHSWRGIELEIQVQMCVCQLMRLGTEI
jgi:hypothetical protein